MPFINQIAHGLADEMVGNRVTGQAVLCEQHPFLFAVIRFAQRAINLKMIAPAGEFHAAVTHLFDERQQFGERQIGPLAGEKRDGSWHGACLVILETHDSGFAAKSFQINSIRRLRPCSDTLLVLLFTVSVITAKQLHLETKAVLNQLERGESLVITRNGRTIGRLEPVAVPESPGWNDIMVEIWQAQKGVKAAARVANPVLHERQRRRR
jgi:hypothetical protein